MGITAESLGLTVVNTPSANWLIQKARSCKSRMLIASPYVNDGIFQLAEAAGDSVSKTLVTRTDLRDFAIGSSNLDSLCSLSKSGFVIRSLSDLHAKIYIFDDSAALVTSANATYSGMRHNRECGLATRSTQIVTKLARSLMRGLGANRPPRVMPLDELEALHIPLATIKANLPADVPKPGNNAPLPDMEYSVADDETLLRGFKGWLRLTLQGVLAIPADYFQMEDLLGVCAPIAALQYPRNYHVAAKLRQQLQVLRDFGLVEFVDRGVYRFTMR
ncbi:MAG: hypothetical protein IIC33_10415, partial [Chloroflexi bacterium]|nr:hypothetical protein [Chloroflexota bacterium]